MSVHGWACAKAENNLVERKIDLSKWPLCDFLDFGKGILTYELLSDLRFDKAWAVFGRSILAYDFLRLVRPTYS